jgi:hypothetical protein
MNRRRLVRENSDCLRAKLEDVVVVAFHLRQAGTGQKGEYHRSGNTRPDSSSKSCSAIPLGAKAFYQVI